MTYIQTPLYPPPSSWLPPVLATLPSWAGAKRVALDIETRDPDLKDLGPGVRRGAYIVGISFAIEDGPAAYLPIAHEGGDNLSREEVLQYLRDQAAVFKGDLCGANIGYDLDFLEEAGVHFTPRFFRDVQVAEPLLDEQQLSYSLENIAIRNGIPGKDERLLRWAANAYGINPKAEMWKLPARYIGAYAEQDARLPLVLLRRQERELEKQGLLGVYDLESRVLPILLKMRRWGVRVDLRRLDEVEEWAVREETEALARVSSLSGIRLGFEDVWNAAALSKVLAPLGLKIPLTPKTKKPSIKKDFLRAIPVDLAHALERARKIDKVRRDFVSSVRKHLVGGRIHTTFNQLKATKDDGDAIGTITGRLSSSDPNMQQIPARDEELGPLFRSIYVPDEGMLWASADFSSQEPRCTIHYAVKAKCTGGQEMANRFRQNPRTDLHQATADLCGIKRKDAKIIFLGLCYGMGSAKLCRSLGLPTAMAFSKRQKKEIEVAGEKGQEILNKFHDMVPFIRDLSDKVQKRAALKGYIRTLSGRRCRFPVDEEKSTDKYREYLYLHKGLNKLIQGASADQTKMAMVGLKAAGLCPQLQVHDEINRSVRSVEEGQEIARIMETCVALRVPTVADLKVEANWGKAK